MGKLIIDLATGERVDIQILQNNWAIVEVPSLNGDGDGDGSCCREFDMEAIEV